MRSEVAGTGELRVQTEELAALLSEALLGCAPFVLGATWVGQTVRHTEGPMLTIQSFVPEQPLLLGRTGR